MFNVSVDTSDFTRELSELPYRINKEAVNELKGIVAQVQQEARKTHRFRSRTGRLENSVQTLIDPSNISGEVYLESDIADYGLYVTEGHGSWSGDKFLDESLNKKEPEIVDRLTNAVERAIGT